MAGGAADCSILMRKLMAEAQLHEMNRGRRMSTARVSRMLSNNLYANRALGLSVGTMILGYDDDGDKDSEMSDSPPKIFYVDNTGVRIPGDMFSAGSGSTFALAILDTERRFDMTEDEAISLGIKAIRHATFRDAFSGGFINVYLITHDGWRKVFTEDVAVTAEKIQKNSNDAST
jgi:20S proteasome subunit beta 5